MKGALTAKMQSLADKIGGTSRVDNSVNPASAASMMKRSIASRAVAKPQSASLPKNQQTYGVPGAK